jgi:hypothetical protein
MSGNTDSILETLIAWNFNPDMVVSVFKMDLETPW